MGDPSYRSIGDLLVNNSNHAIHITLRIGIFILVRMHHTPSPLCVCVCMYCMLDEKALAFSSVFIPADLIAS